MLTVTCPGENPVAFKNPPVWFVWSSQPVRKNWRSFCMTSSRLYHSTPSITLPLPSSLLTPSKLVKRVSSPSPSAVTLVWKSISTPSKSSLSTKLTTPASASAPYTAEAPPVIVSTRSMAADGIVFKSTISAAFAGCARRPSTSTSVRFAPMPRRLTLRDTGRHRTRRYADRVELRVVGHELRHLVQHALDAERARVLEPIGVDRHNRACGVEIATHDARAGDGDLFETVVLRVGGARASG